MRTHPAPDYDRYVLLGTVAGAPVEGEQTWDADNGRLWHIAAHLRLDGLSLESDGLHLSFDQEITTVLNEIPLWAVGRVVELAQTGALEEFISQARRWCN